MIDELTELIESYENGVYAINDIFTRILFLSSKYAIDDIIVALPEPWRTKFLSWARQKFDNPIPLNQFFVINHGDSNPQDLEPITRIREWFRAHDNPA